MFEITLFLCFAGVGILAYVLVPVAIAKTREMNEKNVKNLALKVDVHLQGRDFQKAYRLQIIAPAALGLAGFVFFHDARVFGIFVGIALGVLLGSWPIHIPGVPAPVKLGLAGGPLLFAGA